MSDNWQDRIVGARMSVDDEFAPQVEGSRFSRQEWGMIMTAVEFDIENPGDEDAELVADTSNLETIMPEVERVSEQQSMAGMSGDREDSGSLVDSVKGALGLGGGDDGPDEEAVAEAERLVDSYAVELQKHLEREGRWEEVRAAYRG